MILYFANRKMEILGHATTNLPEGFVITEDLKTEEIETGVATFGCRIGFSKKNRALLEKMTEAGNYLLRSHNNENEFYTIIETEIDTKNQDIYIYAEDAGLDLINEIATDEETETARTAEWFINKYINDSGFEIGINEIPADKTMTLTWDAEETVTARLANIAKAFGNYEISFSFAIDGLVITNKYVNIHKKRGKNIEQHLRLNRDIDRIITKKSVANVATGFLVEGGTPDDSESPITLHGYKYDDGDIYVDAGGYALYSREALKKWSRYIWNKEPNLLKNEKGHILRPYSYDTTDKATLCSHAVAELKKACEMEVNFKVDINNLPKGIKIGDRINIVDESGELFVSTRILLLETSVVDQKHKATLGEHLIKSGGISQKVKELAEQFAKESQSAARALEIAKNAKSKAETAQTAAEAAAKEYENAKKLVEDATSAATGATQSAQAAETAANNAQAAVDNVNNNVESIKNSVETAQAAAQNAAQAASTAETKATEAHTAATNAAKNAENAATASQNAQTVASSAVEKAQTAESAAQQAKNDAQEAETIAQAAKLDAVQAQKDINAFGQDLTTLEDTMQAEYSRKTELTEAQANLQTQITRNAAEIKSTAYKQIVIDETANNAASKVEAAQKAADLAQADADKAAEDAQTAQTAADEANAAALSAQAEADTAKAAADEAKRVADQAEADLNAAKLDLATISSRADATEEEIAAAQTAVNVAQAAVDEAQADVAEAIQKANTAQSAAYTAATNAVNAQATANAAAEAARLAQKTADEAKGDATAAQLEADEAAEIAEEAQRTANEAVENANNLQSAADNAAEEAQAAQDAVFTAAENVDKSESDLAAAQQTLADVLANVDATEQEVAEAQANVNAAQAAAERARADAATAQATADTAQANAKAAQSAADDAKIAAESAQREADEAQAAADKAHNIVSALERRVSTAETNIRQTTSEIQLKANKADVVSDLAAIEQRITEQSAEISVAAEGVGLVASRVEAVENENADLNEKYNEVSSALRVEADGVHISKTHNGKESPYEVFIDDNELSILANGKRAIYFEAADDENVGHIPSLNVSERFALFGLVGQRDSHGNINFVPIGGS